MPWESHVTLWRTREGRRIRVCDLSDSHLAACIARVRERSEWRQEILPILQAEQDERARYRVLREIEIDACLFSIIRRSVSPISGCPVSCGIRAPY